MVRSASAAISRALMSGVIMDDNARFDTKVAALVASLLASSSVRRWALLCSFSLPSENCATPSGERPDLGRGGSSERRRGVASRRHVKISGLRIKNKRFSLKDFNYLSAKKLIYKRLGMYWSGTVPGSYLLGVLGTR